MTANQIAYLKASSEAKLNAAKTRQQEMANQMQQLKDVEDRWFRYGIEPDKSKGEKDITGSQWVFRMMEEGTDRTGKLFDILKPLSSFVKK